MSDIAGFWSYVHEDNRNSGNRILTLAERLSEAFRLISAEPLTLFVDRELAWGDEWEKRISQALQETTFFIPIVTPSYFRSDPCRKELLDFSRAAREFDVEQLILPIYYVDVPELAQDPPTDEAMVLIKGRQWVDLRQVRLLDETDSDHRIMVDALANRLLQIAQNIEEPVGSSTPASPSVGDEIPSIGSLVATEEPVAEDDGDGTLELLARGEEALPRWTETVEKIGEVLQDVGNLTQEAAAEMTANTANESFASRLAAANRLATKLEPPADRLVALGSEYAAHVLEVDPAIRAYAAIVEEQDGPLEGDARSYLESIDGMVSSSHNSMEELMTFSKVLEEPARFSRELRKPARKMQGALRNILDAQSIMDEWQARVRAILASADSTSVAS